MRLKGKTTKKTLAKKAEVGKKPASKKSGPAETTPAKRTSPKAKSNQKPVDDHTSEKTVETKSTTEQNFPIVGIGASAGGLEALERLFAGMPPDTGLSFVIIQHLAPTHKSIMGVLLQKYTKMPIHEIEDGTRVEPNSIYLNPPGADVSIIDRTLMLTSPSASNAMRLPINHFFRSLAEDQGRLAICIVLSGTGSDGSLGLQAIKGEGGLTIAQEESQAGYDSMPRSAIQTGMVDYILRVENMPAQLRKYVDHPYVKAPDKLISTRETLGNFMKKIFLLVRAKTGHDFSHYKENTTRRRIERRMAVHQIDNITNYYTYLSQNLDEVHALYRDMLISVTNFFRNPEAFDILKKKVIPDLLKTKKEDSHIRIWVPACATGEEAYSIAILFVEALEKLDKHMGVQMFATDIDLKSIDFARAAEYPVSISADVDPKRLKRFFIREDNHYKVKKEIRELVVFADQNLIKDPPFSKLDMVSCRNLLIYMEKILQDKVLNLFHYTLHDGGVLFLGSSESIGGYSEYFSPYDTKNKIYKRTGTQVERDFGFQDSPHFDLALEPAIKPIAREKSAETIQRIAEQAIMDSYAPAFVLVNEKHEIVYFNGDTSDYLAPPIGQPVFNILSMAREDLRFKLHTAINKAIRYGKSVTVKNFQALRGEKLLHFDIQIKRLHLTKVTTHTFWMVVFEEKKIKRDTASKASSKKDRVDPRITNLERELQATKEYLQSTNEELETTNEELKSANEELQSTNEEMQSSNEELETSKEELQATNEELSTVNSELQSKVNDLSKANNDLNNLLASTEIATIFLDSDLCVNRYTPSVTRIFNLKKGDVGRPISDITFNLQYNALYDDARVVLDTLERKEIQVETTDGRWMTLRILPYRTLDNVIEGLVLTFMDVTILKKADESVRESEIKLKEALKQSAVTVFTHDKDLRYTWIYGPHPAFDEKEIVGKTDYDLVSRYDADILMALKRKALESGVAVRETVRLTLNGEESYFDITIIPVRNSGGEVCGVTCYSTDVTKRKIIEESMREKHEGLVKEVESGRNALGQMGVYLKEQREFFDLLVDASSDGITVNDEKGNYLVYNASMERIIGYTKEEASGDDFPTLLFTDPDYRQKAMKALEDALEGVDAKGQKWILTRKDGATVEVAISTTVVRQGGKRLLLGVVKQADK